MDFIVIRIDEPKKFGKSNYSISLNVISKEKADTLTDYNVKGKKYLLALGRGSNKNSVRMKDLPKHLQERSRMALHVMGLW